MVGGEARVGDWLLENAVARFAIRDVYSSLSVLGEAGGTVVDAAAFGQTDLLMEVIPDGDRSEILPIQEEGVAELRLPGVSYRLSADSAVLEIDAPYARFRVRPGLDRVGASCSLDTLFVGLSGTSLLNEGGQATVTGPLRLSIEPDQLFEEAEDFSAETDADSVLVALEEQALARLPVEDGWFSGRVPLGATLTGEKEGCSYEGLTQAGCGLLKLRLEDNTGHAVGGVLTDGETTWVIPKGGGSIPVGPMPRELFLWAGPMGPSLNFWYSGPDAELERTLIWEVDRSSWGLAVLDREVAPDTDTDLSSWDLLDRLGAEGVEFVVVLADDEVPGIPADFRDRPWAAAGSRAGDRAGLGVWSWPWEPNIKKAGHGAVPWEGFDALDILRLSAGKDADRRRTVATASWVEAALNTPVERWEPVPEAIYLEKPEELSSYLSLLERSLWPALLGPTSWLGVGSDRNIPDFERAILEHRSIAGNGPRIWATISPIPQNSQFLVVVQAEAPAWMGLQQVEMITDQGRFQQDYTPGMLNYFWIPVSTHWLLSATSGQPHPNPWLNSASWAISSAIRLDQG
jgi:hypothetical protein